MLLAKSKTRWIGASISVFNLIVGMGYNYKRTAIYPQIENSTNFYIYLQLPIEHVYQKSIPGHRYGQMDSL